MFRWKATVAAVALSALAAAPAMSQSTGFAEFVAVINFNGVIARGSGISAAAEVSTGTYNVTLPRNVLTCYPIVSVSGNGGFATAVPLVSKPTQVKVQTFDTTGAPARRNFNILVRCQD